MIKILTSLPAYLLFLLLFFNFTSYGKIDHLHNLTYKEEFEGNTSPRTAAYTLVHKDSSTGPLYKLPLEEGYVKKPKIITSITPISSIVTMLVKDKAEIETLATNSDCPHHYNLKPSDLDKVKDADIAIYIDGQFDGFAEKLMRNHNNEIIRISDIQSLWIIKNDNEKNWHIWLDLVNVQILLKELAKELAKKFPALQQDINKNLLEALKDIEALTVIKNNELGTLKDVILLNDSAEYFFINTNIKVSKLYSTSQKSLRYPSKLKDLLNASVNKCLILSSQQDSRLYQKLNTKIIKLASENWALKDVDSKTFYNEYLQMINQVQRCR